MSVFLSTLALLMSAASLAVAVWHWRQSNRPVVTVRIRTHKGGNVAIAYWIEILNSGARPARNVRLQLDNAAIEAALAEGAREVASFEKDIRAVRKCFDERAMVPILPNGEIVANTFGHTGAPPFWIPGTVLHIGITYEGLEGQKYETTVPIRIDDTSGFAGSSYEGEPEPRYH